MRITETCKSVQSFHSDVTDIINVKILKITCQNKVIVAVVETHNGVIVTEAEMKRMGNLRKYFLHAL